MHSQPKSDEKAAAIKLENYLFIFFVDYMYQGPTMKKYYILTYIQLNKEYKKALMAKAEAYIISAFTKNRLPLNI